MTLVHSSDWKFELRFVVCLVFVCVCVCVCNVIRYTVGSLILILLFSVDVFWHVFKSFVHIPYICIYNFSNNTQNHNFPSRTGFTYLYSRSSIEVYSTFFTKGISQKKWLKHILLAFMRHHHTGCIVCKYMTPFSEPCFWKQHALREEQFCVMILGALRHSSSELSIKWLHYSMTECDIEDVMLSEKKTVTA